MRGEIIYNHELSKVNTIKIKKVKKGAREKMLPKSQTR
jgi:hypothetical protein